MPEFGHNQSLSSETSLDEKQSNVHAEELKP